MNSIPLTFDDPAKQQLFQLLLEEIHAYSYLADTVKQKQEALIKNELKNLENLTGIERLLIKKVELMIRNRSKLLNKLLGNRSHDSTVQLNTFIEQLPLEEQSRWRRLQQRMIRTVEKIRRLNFENHQLVQSSLNYIKGVIEMLYALDEESVLYNSNGQEKKTALPKQVVNYNV